MENGFAQPRKGIRVEDCDFYHTVEIPGRGTIRGQWDLRGHVDEYLGGYAFGDKRVLEIGPATGFLTFEMERRGGRVVALEVPNDPGWDFVPFPEDLLRPIITPRREHMNRIKNSFWFLHELNQSRAQICYGDSSCIPIKLGTFDVAVMAAVLLHCERPVRIMAECAKRSATLIVTDVYTPDLEGSPVCRLVPNAENQVWHTWWQFSTEFIVQYFRVLGFRTIKVTQHEQLNEIAGKVPFFTIVGSKTE